MTVPRMIVTKPSTLQVNINLKTNKATVKQVKAAGVKKSSEAQFDALMRKKMTAKRKKSPAKKSPVKRRVNPTMMSSPSSGPQFAPRKRRKPSRGQRTYIRAVADLERKEIMKAARANRKRFAVKAKK